jgi:hypothetical protein
LKHFYFSIHLWKNKKTLFFLLPEIILCGSQTPEYPTKCNACVLYHICKYYDIEMNSETPIYYMRNAILMLRKNTYSMVQTIQEQIHKETNKSTLINIYMKLNKKEFLDPPTQYPTEEDIYTKNTQRPLISYDQMGRIFHSLHEVSILQKNIVPSTNEGAISLAALLYKINISYAKNPIQEYTILKESTLGLYVPADHWFSFWLYKQPILFSTNISFHPMFPIDFYVNNDLNKLLKYSGIKPNPGSTKEDKYSLLQLLYATDTFFENEMPFMKKRETIITCTSINSLEHGEILVYGTMETNFIPISIQEMMDCFSFHGYFYNPFTPQPHDDTLSYTSIQKLKSILSNKTCTKNVYRVYKSISKQVKLKRKQLLQLILTIEEKLACKDEHTDRLIEMILSENEETKEKIGLCFYSLLHIGLAMRGYSGEGVYPVKNVPPVEDHMVALRTTTCIQNFEEACNKLPVYGEYIMNLPLVLYSGKTYYSSNSIQEGLSIKDRIEIIKRGNDTTNTASCIRLSSNWICSSAVKYMNALDIKHDINISEMAYIF